MTVKLVIGVVVGAIVAMGCVYGLEMLGHHLYPPPPGTDFSNPDDLKRLMEQMPAAAIALVAVSWFTGALAGAWVANAIALRALAGWIVALLILAACVFNLVMIPHPAWMWAAGILLPLLAGWLAQRLARVAF